MIKWQRVRVTYMGLEMAMKWLDTSMKDWELISITTHWYWGTRYVVKFDDGTLDEVQKYNLLFL